jgi:16S rRNA (uracil1498-N3)-methyltransferase
VNSLLVFSHEELDGKFVLQNERARYYHEWHGYEEGRELPIGIWGRSRGWGRVESISQSTVVVSILKELPPIPRMALSLIVAIPRPQILKRVLLSVVSFGVSKVWLVKTDLFEKSYLTSRELEESRLHFHLLKALEQTGDVTAPQVAARDTLTDVLDATKDFPQFYCDGDGSNTISVLERKETKVICIGPERGWSLREKHLFAERGVDGVSFGPRILRVDLAVTLIASTAMVHKAHRSL